MYNDYTMAEDEMKELFKNACSYVRTTSETLRSDDLLYFYARYKQVVNSVIYLTYMIVDRFGTVLSFYVLYYCIIIQCSSYLATWLLFLINRLDWNSDAIPSKAKQRCVMGVGMCLYAQLVQTKGVV